MWLVFANFSEQTDRYIEALGKALVLAQHFEANCKYVAMISGLVKRLETGEISVFIDDAWKKFISRAEKSNLATSISTLTSADETASILTGGRSSRNRIVHEAALGLPFSPQRPERCKKQVNLLRDNVRQLALADNLVSCWSFEIQEKQAAPINMTAGYVEDCMSWVFSGFVLADEGVEEA